MRRAIAAGRQSGKHVADVLARGWNWGHNSDVSEPANANAAFIVILRGEVEQGFADYESGLKGDYLPDVPAGLHVGMLEQAGRVDEARRLTSLALRCGADLSCRAGPFGADPSEAAKEYEALFERGLVNSRMIYKYLKLLAEQGRMEEHARILAPEQLFDTAILDVRLAEAVDAMLLDLEQQAEQQEAVQSVRKMGMLGGLAKLDHPAAKDLIAQIDARTAEYLKRWRASNHPFGRFVSEQFELQAWGLISRGEGYNIPHIHAVGWATGVFYPRSILGSGGELVIGRPKDAAGSDRDWGARRLKPQAGLLVLMPSFYTHWTIPLDRPGLRTSVAFDVVRPV
jgi:hypothetical protein